MRTEAKLVTTSEWSRNQAAPRVSDAPIFWLVAAGVGFNFVLAIANAHVLSISGTHVQIVQLAITAAALLLTFLRGGPAVPFAFPALVVAFVVLSAISAFAAGASDIKTIYDVVLLCTFIALGSTVGRLPLRVLNWMLLLSAAVAAFEYLMPAAYTQLVDPLGYFSSTRAWVAEAMGDTFTDGAALGISGIRGGGESWLGLSMGGHRVGGIFLEPLGQGYFAAVLAIFYSYHFQDDFRRRTLACIACLMLALISDTRLAVLLIGFFYIAAPIARRLPAKVAYLVPVLGLAASMLMFSISGDSTSEFVFRLSLTFQTLLHTPLYNLLFGGVDLTFAADSGIVTILSRAGLLGLAVFFVIGSGLASMHWRVPTVLILVSIYLFATALFGAAFLSIKTAALLGLLIGATGTGAFAPGFSAERRRGSR